MTTIEVLKKAISDKGLSYSQLSELTGITKSSLQRYITGATDKIPFKAIRAMSEVLNISLHELLEGSDCDSIVPPATVPELQLTNHEKNIIISYRNNKAMQEAVDKLLGVTASDE